jgi:single-stranded-DNA-specific exonuclease
MEPQNDLAHYPALAQTLLKNRGITTREAAERFLNPSYQNGIYDPFLIMNMERAVERIYAAIQAGEKIIVYGDYDCDGIPGSVVLHDFFKKIKYENFQNYIPHRHNEGVWLEHSCNRKFRKRRREARHYGGLWHYGCDGSNPCQRTRY